MHGSAEERGAEDVSESAGVGSVAVGGESAGPVLDGGRDARAGRYPSVWRNGSVGV